MAFVAKKCEVSLCKLRVEQSTDEMESGKCRSLQKSLYLVPFFNFLFYMGYSPFKLEFNLKEDKYFAKSYKVHQIMCALVQSATIFTMSYITWYALLDITSNGSTMKSKIGINIFDVISNTGMVVTAVFITHMTWCRQKLMLEVIEASRIYCGSPRKFRVGVALVNSVCVIVLLFVGILDWHMFQSYYYAGTSRQMRSTVVSFMNVSLEKSILGQDDELQNVNRSTTFKNKNVSGSIDQNVGVMLLAAVWVYLAIFYAACQLVFMILTLTLKHIGSEFRKQLKEHGFCESNGLHQGITLYKTLKTTTELIHALFGNALIGYYTASVSYLAEAPYVLLGHRGNTERLIMIYMAFGMAVWVAAAEFHYQTRRTLMEWVGYHCDREGLSMEDRFKLLTISGEISSSEVTTVALSNKCFPVTYKHLSSMAGLMVTYGIIVFQIYNGS